MKIELEDKSLGFSQRDLNSKAILNTDMHSLVNYKTRKRRAEEISKSIDDFHVVKNEINNLKCELSEIKQLLLTITTTKN
jgi:hypothetical protein